MPQYTPTPEQAAILEGFSTGGSMIVEAGAGTGKTTTLKMLASTTSRSGLYIAFNRSVADEAAATFTPNVSARTAHSIAYGAYGYRFKDRLNGPRVTAYDAAKALGITRNFTFGEVDLKPVQLARLVLQGVNQFCYSADPVPHEKNLPFVKGEGDLNELRRYLEPFLVAAWEDLTQKQGNLRYTHDCYLKQWALTRPELNFDFLMLDEAQDSNPVISNLVQAQQGRQLVLVGDSNQAIYGWRGAVDAMSQFDADHHLYLSQSFRFGGEIAGEANKWLELLQAPLRLVGTAGFDSAVGKVDRPDAVLCRSNAGVINEVAAQLNEDRKVAIVGGADAIIRFAEAAEALQTGRPTSHPDLIGFADWESLVEYTANHEGTDLRVLVSLVNKYSSQGIIRIAQSTVPETAADVVVSTAHKAKGREWGKVLIGSDFPEPNEENTMKRPEMMLAYVAVTRAQNLLDRKGLRHVDKMLHHLQQRAAEPVDDGLLKV